MARAIWRLEWRGWLTVAIILERTASGRSSAQRILLAGYILKEGRQGETKTHCGDKKDAEKHDGSPEEIEEQEGEAALPAGGKALAALFIPGLAEEDEIGDQAGDVDQQIQKQGQEREADKAAPPLWLITWLVWAACWWIWSWLSSSPYGRHMLLRMVMKSHNPASKPPRLV